MAAILLDEMLNAITKVISELKVNRDKIASNIEITKGQVFSEFVLEALVKKGVARFEAYRDIQRVAFAALESGDHFFDAASRDKSISKHLSKRELAAIFEAKNHLSASGRIIDNVDKMVRTAVKA